MQAISLGNLLSWSIQVSAIAAVGALLPFALRVRHPRSHLVYCYALLVICLTLPFMETWQHPVIHLPVASRVALSADALNAAAPAHFDAAFQWEQLLKWVLLAGIFLRMSWFVAGLWHIRRYRKAARSLFPLPVSAMTACELAGSSAEICISTADVGPVTFGLRRPIVLLPESFLSLSDEAQRAIVCHELLHVKRRDWLVTVVEELVGAGLWFHPAVWWLLNQTRLAREQVVDAEVVRLTNATEPYIGALLAMSGADPGHGFITAPGFLRKRHLTLRMRSILMEVPMSRLRLSASYIFMTCVLVAAGWVTLNAFPLIGQPQIQESTVTDGPGISVDPGGGVLHRTPILYPAALQGRINGTVTVRLTLNAKGEVIDALVVAGPDELRKDVLQSVLQWRYVANVSTRTIQAKVEFQALPLEKQYKDSISFFPDGYPRPLLGAIDVSALPESLRAEVSKRVQGFIGQPFSDSLFNQIEAAASGTGSNLQLQRSGAQDGKQTLKFVVSPSAGTQQASTAPFELRIKVPSQPEPQESDLTRKVREQSQGRPYVIADDEKAAYERLTTDEEREHFIEQFWQRREAVRTNLALAGSQEVLRVGGNVSAPRIVAKVDPQYSEEARAARLSGTVVMEAVVEADGSVRVERIVRSLGYGLDEAAVEALQQWRFSPAMQNGNPVAVRLNIEVNFNMK